MFFPPVIVIFLVVISVSLAGIYYIFILPLFVYKVKKLKTHSSKKQAMGTLVRKLFGASFEDHPDYG